MAVDAKTVKELRELTGLPMMQCKRALEETGGDIAKAEDHLKKQGAKVAEKRAHRETGDGTIGFYIHHDGKTGVMVEVNCESDFVAKNDDFRALAKDLAMHVTAHVPTPLGVSREDVPAAAVEKEREIILGQLEQDEKMKNKPEEVRRKIADGKLEKFFAERALLEQSFVKDPSVTIKSLVQQTIQKTGENITVRRFVRYKVGEE